ncbi:MAG: glycosyltransferase [Spirochaetales bacterium]|nr:glycosyltransferase [Spirochaetales bacterium]
MRILQVNKFYPFKGITSNNKPDYHYSVGDTETLIHFIDSLLTTQNHEVIHFSMEHPENGTSALSTYFVPYSNLHHISGVKNTLKSIGAVLYSTTAKKRLSALLDRYPVDIAHLHNIHHQLSPSIIDEFRKRSIPVVMTLHDFKMVCPSYNMLHKDRICEACKGKHFYHCIIDKCHNDSLYKSMVVAMESYLHHFVLKTYKYVRYFICPSRFLMKKVQEMGLKGTFFHVPNYLDCGRILPSVTWKERTIVYFGRLIKIKGLYTLLDAVKHIQHIHVNIIGDGPLKRDLLDKIKKESIKNISFLGYKHGEELQEEIRKAMFVILPSEVYENYPYSIQESFALGKPVIGSHIGGIPELCKEKETGLTFNPGNSKELRTKIEYLLADPAKITEMGRNARSFIENINDPGAYYQTLLAIYKTALQG